MTVHDYAFPLPPARGSFSVSVWWESGLVHLWIIHVAEKPQRQCLVHLLTGYEQSVTHD